MYSYIYIGVDVQVSEDSLTVHVPPHPELTVAFPVCVDAERAKARLVKSKGLLKIVAPRV
jgi:hypothetical protein